MRTNERNDEFEALWSDPFSRRRLLQVAGLGFGAVVLGSVTSSCANETANGPAAPAAKSLSTAMSSTFPNLTPLNPSIGTFTIADLYGDKLYRLDPFPPRTDLRPDLATEPPEEISPTSYRIRLRTDVTFHDGKPFTAEDVVYTLQQLTDPEEGTFFGQFLSFISSAEAAGDHELILTLGTPTSLLMERLSLPWIIPAGIAQDDLKTTPIGTGPYRVSSAIGGERAVLQRFAEYSGEREPNYEEVEITQVPDANARISGIRSRRFKIIEEPPASSFEELGKAEGVKTGSSEGYMSTKLYFNCGRPPLTDNRVRQAICYAIDRDAITDTSFLGHAAPEWKGWFSRHPDFVPPSTAYSFDPDRAVDLLAAAGHSGKEVPVDFIFASDRDFISTQVPIIEQNLKAVGFAPNLIPGETAAHIGRMVDGNYGMCILADDPSAYHPSLELMLQIYWSGSHPRDILHWEGDSLTRIETLLNEAFAAGDAEERKQLLGEVQEIAQTEVPIHVLHTVDQLSAWSSDLSGFRPSPTHGFVLDGVSG